jgi:hypothetical protein
MDIAWAIDRRSYLTRPPDFSLLGRQGRRKSSIQVNSPGPTPNGAV